MLKINNLRTEYKYKNKIIRYNIDLEAEENQTNIILGKTGIGKTTFFSCLAGLIPTISGSIRLDSKEIAYLLAEKRPVLFMFQENNLFLHLKLLTNLTLGFTKKELQLPEFKKSLEELLEFFEITALKKIEAGKFSGGQKQLSALARLVLLIRHHNFVGFKHKIIILDEPFNGLDISLHKKLVTIIQKELKANNNYLFISTHQIDLAKKLATKMWLVQEKDEQIVICPQELFK